MKKIFFLLCFTSFAFASEREDLLKSLEARFQKSVEMFEKCDGPQAALTVASGNHWTNAESLLAEAADWKLRNVRTPQERREVLNAVYRIGRKVEAVRSAPYEEGCGSAESMQRYNIMANLVMRQVQIFLLSESQAKLWNGIRNAKGMVSGRQIELEDGIFPYPDESENPSVSMEFSVEPENCFVCGNRVFALAEADYPKAFNSDFLHVYLLRFDAGKIVSVQELEPVYFQKLSVKGNMLTLEGQASHQGGKYKKTVDLTKIP